MPRRSPPALAGWRAGATPRPPPASLAGRRATASPSSSAATARNAPAWRRRALARQPRLPRRRGGGRRRARARCSAGRSPARLAGRRDGRGAGRHRHRPAAALRRPARHRRGAGRAGHPARASASAIRSARSPPPPPPALLALASRRAAGRRPQPAPAAHPRPGPHGRARRDGGGRAAGPRRARHDRRARAGDRRDQRAGQRSPSPARRHALRPPGAQAAAARRWSFVALDLDYAFHSAAMDRLRDGLLADLAGLRRPRAAGADGLDRHRRAARRRRLRPGLLVAQPARAGALPRRGARPPPRAAPACSSRSARTRCCRATCATACAAPAAAPRPAILPSLSRRDPHRRDPFPAIADRAFAAGADPRERPGLRRRGAARAACRPRPSTASASGTAPRPRRARWRRPGRGPSAARLPPAAPSPASGPRHLDTALEPWLADHRLAGEPVLPAAAMLEMALAAGRRPAPGGARRWRCASSPSSSALPLEAERARELRSQPRRPTARFTLRQPPPPGGGALDPARRRPASAPLPAPAGRRAGARRCRGAPAGRRGDPLRAGRRGSACDYGPAFQSLDAAGGRTPPPAAPRRGCAGPRPRRRMPVSCCTRRGWTARCRG